jgi:O-antigen/teichoic acid export membrane protein
VLVTTPIIVNRFGVELMGIWLLANQIVAYLPLTGVGVPNGMARFLARFYALEDHESARRFFSTALVGTCVAGLAIVGLTMAGAAFIGDLMNLPAKYHNVAATVAAILGVSVAFTLSLQLGQGLLASLHRFDRIALWLTVSAVVRFVLIIGSFIGGDPGIVVLAVISAGANLFGFALMLWDGLGKSPSIRFDFSLFSFAALREILSVGVAALFITLAALLTRQGSTILVGRLLGPAAVTLFALPLMILNYITPLLSILQIQIYPVASGMAAIGDKAKLLRVYSSIVSISISVILLAFLGSILAGKQLLGAWLMHGAIAAEQIANMAMILTILLGSYAVAVPGIMGRAILESVGLHRKAAQLEVAAALVGLAIGYLAIHFLKIGVIGMAIGISAAFVFRGGKMFVETAVFLSQPYLGLLKATCLKPFAICCLSALAGGAAYLFLRYIDVRILTGWRLDAVVFLVAATTWGVGNWLTILDKFQRDRISSAVNTAWPL